MILNRLVLFSFLLVFTTVRDTGAAGRNVLCYYEGWKTDFGANDIDVNICTHILFAFLGLTDDGTITHVEENNAQIQQLTDLKNKNANLKLLLSVGGWNEGSVVFSNLAANPAARQNFLSQSIMLLQRYNFDGLDVDWEYPGEREGSVNDRQTFVTLLRELKIGLNNNGYILTIAVNGQASLQGYDVPNINANVDFINLMLYDFHSGNEPNTGANAPLDEVEAAANSWLNSGATPDKLILGLGFYGKSFTLADANEYWYGAPAVGFGQPGPLVGEPGYLSYEEICVNHWPTEWSDEHSIPFAHDGNQWVGYDNPDSIKIKVNFAKSKDFAGVMMWAVNIDDKRGACGRPNGLLNAIKETI